MSRLSRIWNRKGVTIGGRQQISRDAYRDLPGINASILKQPTTLEMLYALERKDEPLSYALQFGSLLHLAILEPDKFDDLDRSPWVTEIKTATLKTKEAEAALKAHPGTIIATSKMIEKAGRARDACYAHKQFAALMGAEPYTEAAYQAWDQTWSGWRKGLVDIVPQEGSWLGDLKTTTIDLSESWRMGREARDYGYLFSAAYYAWLHEEVTGTQIENYVIAWISGPKGEYADASSQPWICRMQVIPHITTTDDPCLVAQLSRIRERLDMLRAAYEANLWVAFEDEVLAF